METNKLLTLEEIEKYERHCTGDNAVQMSDDSLKALLATARAYWELKNKTPGLPQVADDKPHLPTIKAVIEALDAGREFVGNINDDALVFNSVEAVISLEKHLE